MIYRKSAALAMALLMVLVSSALVVRAEEEPALPMPYTPYVEGQQYAVYFADNMAFTPQWRLGNLLRIEIMVLKTSGGLADATNADGELVKVLTDPLPSMVNVDLTTGVAYDQADFMADPNLLLNTPMVSVPVIGVTIEVIGTAGTVYSDTFWADFTVDGDESGLGREVNKAGHLIYGMLFDTTVVPSAGVPKVTVHIPTTTVTTGSFPGYYSYPVSFAVRSFVLAEDDEASAYEVLPADGGLVVVGAGGVAGGDAYIYVGVLMAKGGSSGGGGGNGPKGRQ